MPAPWEKGGRANRGPIVLLVAKGAHLDCVDRPTP
jgi:hypothetical protein